MSVGGFLDGNQRKMKIKMAEIQEFTKTAVAFANVGDR
jgi:hypothetical protein